MRKILFALFAAMFTLLGGVAATSALAKSVDSAPVTFTVDGTFSTAAGEAGTEFQGTVTVDSFVDQDGQLAVQGTLTGPDGLFAPLTVTVEARALATDDAASGCTVSVTTVNFFINTITDGIDGGFIIFGTSSVFTLRQSDEPEAARELCGVVRAAAKDPVDQLSLIRPLNRALRAV